MAARSVRDGDSDAARAELAVEQHADADLRSAPVHRLETPEPWCAHEVWRTRVRVLLPRRALGDASLAVHTGTDGEAVRPGRAIRD